MDGIVPLSEHPAMNRRGAPHTAHRAAGVFRQFGWQRGVFRPILEGRKAFLFAGKRFPIALIIISEEIYHA